MDDVGKKQARCQLRGFCRFCTEGPCPLAGPHSHVSPNAYQADFDPLDDDAPGWDAPHQCYGRDTDGFERTGIDMRPWEQLGPHRGRN